MKAAAVQQAIYTRLNDASITSLLSTAYSPLVPIFSTVPQGLGEDSSRFPFITIGPDNEAGFDAVTFVGSEIVVQVQIWSRGTMHSMKAIADAVDLRLRRQPLSGLTGHVTTEFEGATFFQDPDGITNRAAMQFRVLVK